MAEVQQSDMGGPCRVEKRAGIGRIWDVYCDDIGDYLATMNPTLPVSNKSVAERICAGANARRAALASTQAAK